MRTIINNVFPTHVGMNRHRAGNGRGLGRIPHARGDEPADSLKEAESIAVFPTHVGMNR